MSRIRWKCHSSMWQCAYALGHCFEVPKLVNNTRTGWWLCPEGMDERARQTSELQMKPLDHSLVIQSTVHTSLDHKQQPSWTSAIWESSVKADSSNSSYLTEPLIKPNQLLVVNGPEWTTSSGASRPTVWYPTHRGKQISHSPLVLWLILRPSASPWTGNSVLRSL